MRIGWIGTGVMGSPMGGHLLDAGDRGGVRTRTQEPAQGAPRGGASWCDAPAEVADGAQAVFTMLGFPADVRETILGEGGLLATLDAGTLLVDHTTSEPSLAEE